MGQQQSKDELLYQQVNYGNVEGIKALRREGAGLEWMDSEGKTPLIVACMNAELYNVAKVLIELGANVNAYRPGRHAGTPLHHAAKRGLEQTVKLLLSLGANALVMNDDCQTPLDVARAKGYSNVVRAIEAHVCLFSGWLRELYGPGFLELLAPQLLSRKVWVVILPCGSRNLRKPFKLELAIYAGAQDAQPRTIVPLWKANLEEPNFNQPDPAAIIADVSRIPKRWRRKRAIKSSQEAKRKSIEFCYLLKLKGLDSSFREILDNFDIHLNQNGFVLRCPRCFLAGTRIKLVPVTESDKQQLQWFCSACKGIPQAVHPLFPFNNQSSSAPATAPPASEDEELAMAINASLQSASHERPPPVDTYAAGTSSSAASTNISSHEESNIGGPSSDGPEAGPSGGPAQLPEINPSPVSLPSAPHAENAASIDGPIHYPSIDASPVVISGGGHEKREEDGGGSCTICLDAPLEGACVPCGHLAGCMSCLNEVKAKKWGCPVCRAKIDQRLTHGFLEEEERKTHDARKRTRKEEHDILLGANDLSTAIPFVRDIVLEFYANMLPSIADLNSVNYGKVFLRGQVFAFTPDLIDDLFGTTTHRGTFSVVDMDEGREIRFSFGHHVFDIVTKFATSRSAASLCFPSLIFRLLKSQGLTLHPDDVLTGDADWFAFRGQHTTGARVLDLPWQAPTPADVASDVGTDDPNMVRISAQLLRAHVASIDLQISKLQALRCSLLEALSLSGQKGGESDANVGGGSFAGEDDEDADIADVAGTENAADDADDAVAAEALASLAQEKRRKRIRARNKALKKLREKKKRKKSGEGTSTSPRRSKRIRKIDARIS
ncbi:putative E3 ubiquitin-protein ligase xbat35 [Phtheirospermum japonicum]|uniref:Putative E3 ubiquitin-protein ligase xbat35 n=1 Tax=Phtheirospermum japonicum TaxID=374723 RepID=A0A830B6T4_9LAMI|nr:putative E3 ubiquitin-protein ligase xbat35 [Phtheirospermum japonicum]